MKRPWIAAIALIAALIEPAEAQVSPFESDVPVAPQNRIDELVLRRLKKLRIAPARLCSDAVFVRRVHLDAIGTLPTAQVARTFLQDRAPDKRAALIERLLEREEFADYWALKWCDLLRVKAEFPINLWPNAVQAYHRWIRTCIAENVPYDRFARELLTSSGSCFREAPVNFYRANQGKDPGTLARAVALTFMGVRAESWPQERWADMAVFFARLGTKGTAEWKEEIVFFDTSRPAVESAVLPDGKRVRLDPQKDPRAVFARWLIRSRNPWFTRNIANRVWSWLQGRGIVHEPDDFRDDNPPANPELLAHLQNELVKSKYDLKHLYRLILNSTTYQLSSIPGSDHPQAEANFAHYPLRRLEAEVLIDALCQITGTTEKYQSAIPEPFTFIPEEQRSITLADGSISSPFLEMFGRPSRDTGLESERGNQPSDAQRLHLLNSSHIRNKIERGPALRALLRGGNRKRGQALKRIYLHILSREPTPQELRLVGEYAKSGAAPQRAVAADLVWALINSPEFLYRH